MDDDASDHESTDNELVAYEQDEVEEARLPGPPAVYARNWKTVLAVDAGMGVLVMLVGAFVAVRSNIAIGAAIAVLGSAYVTLVANRARQWAAWRRDAGL